MRSTQEIKNLELVLRMYREVLIAMDAEAVDRFMAADYMQHSTFAAPGVDGLKEFLRRVRQETPDSIQDIKRAFVDGDHVVIHCHVRPIPTEAGIAVVDIFRVADGRIAEHWDVFQPIVTQGRNPNSMF
jgi:predicted SnoaL-like aldol condensation-catalyzing enzyme